MEETYTQEERRNIRVLAVDDDATILDLVKEYLEDTGYTTQVASSGEEAMERLREQSFDLVVVDLKMPGMSGLDLVGHVSREYPDTEKMIVTGYGTKESALEAFALGVRGYVEKERMWDTLLPEVHRIVEKRLLQIRNARVMQELRSQREISGIIGDHPNTRLLKDRIRMLAETEEDILVWGESGTGKELVARTLHRESARGGAFVPVNCAAIPETLWESVVFGHERGAYTSANSQEIGLLEHAQGGTVLFDEIATMPLSCQGKLLRVLEQREFQRVGGSEMIALEARMMYTTNRDLDQMVREGTFREDLYYRVDVLRIEVPPLRERREDVFPLAVHFLDELGEKDGREQHLSAEASQVLMRYEWPGNVRELRHVLTKAHTFCDNEEIGVLDLPKEVREPGIDGSDAHGSS